MLFYCYTKMLLPPTVKEIRLVCLSHVTQELLPALLYVLQKVHRQPWLISISTKLDINRPDIMYIVVCSPGRPLIGIVHYIYWQLEYFPPNTTIGQEHVDYLRGAYAVWDYCPANIEIIKAQLGIEATLVRPGYVKLLQGPASKVRKDIDVLFLGWIDISEHRKEVQRKLQALGLKTMFTCGHALPEICKLIARSKICINIHYHSPFVLQTVRLNILLSNRACVVSEAASDTETQELYAAHGVTFVTYDMLVPKCVELVMDDDERNRLARESYTWYSTERKWQHIVEWGQLVEEVIE